MAASVLFWRGTPYLLKMFLPAPASVSKPMMALLAWFPV